MNKKLIHSLLCLLVFLMAGCSPSETPTESSQNSDQNPPAFTRMNRDQLANYTATVVIQFQGPLNWNYQLLTRKSPSLREENLHIEGIDTARNPGDIRLVTDGAETRMVGPGTDNECLQFPNNQGMDPTFIFPETLVSDQDLNGLLAFAGEEELLGKPSRHYSGRDITFGNWKDASVDIWQDKDSQTMLRFTLQATGNDEFFNTGTGTLYMWYEVSELDSGTIQPVEGCEISVPLPDSVEKFVRLPGMASFETTAGPDEIRSFYQAMLPQQGWAEKETTTEAGDSVVLSYARDAEEVEIYFEAAATGGTKVKLLFQQNQ